MMYDIEKIIIEVVHDFECVGKVTPETRNCNLSDVSESAADAFDRGFTAGHNAAMNMCKHSR